MTRKLERSPLYGVDCHESMGAPLNDHLQQHKMIPCLLHLKKCSAEFPQSIFDSVFSTASRRRGWYR